MPCNSYSNGSGAPITISGTLPASFCHTTWAATFLAFRNAMTAQLPGSYAGLVTGSSEPATSDRDKLWFRVKDTCEPMGLFAFYNGAWRRAIPHHLQPGMIIDYYSATLTTDHVENTRIISFLDVYDETYTPGNTAASPFWRVCDGSNGTPDLRGRVRVGAGQGPSPLTNRLVNTSFGEESHLLQVSELPQIDVKAGSGAGTTGLVRGLANNVDTFTITGGNAAHNNVQPSFAVYPIMRTSRTI